MIETKEQYERLKAETQNLGYIALEGTGVHIIETIEALREVARAANLSMQLEQAHWSKYFGSVEEYEDARLKTAGEFWNLFNALPDWLTDG